MHRLKRDSTKSGGGSVKHTSNQQPNAVSSCLSSSLSANPTTTATPINNANVATAPSCSNKQIEETNELSLLNHEEIITAPNDDNEDVSKLKSKNQKDDSNPSKFFFVALFSSVSIRFLFIRCSNIKPINSE